MHLFDWFIVFIVLVGMIYSVSYSTGLMKSVTDFLSAGRSAGRYLLSISSGIAGLGAISVVMFLEMGYESGFSLAWWGLSQGIIILMLTMSGWVIYRFRSTRCLTLAEFFEKRYSRGFRIFTGIIAFFAGIINFGIFPAVGAQFFLSFCNLPESFLGISTYPMLMLLLLCISLYFVITGGQIAIIIADFFQGIFSILVLLIIVSFLLFDVGLERISDSLHQTPINIANTEIQELHKDRDFQTLSESNQKEKIETIKEKYENSSRINPFKTGHIENFNFWYFLIGIIGVMYGAMGWQGSQAYNSSAKSAHEAKMGSVLAGFRGMAQGTFFLMVPILIYVYMNHNDYNHVKILVNQSLSMLDTETLRSQMRGPIVLSVVLPTGLMGAFAAFMLAAFISTHDTYLHSWSTILVQDVIMPFRKKPFDKDTHFKVLRLSIFAVAIFIFLFSLLFQQNQKIALYFAITAAIFSGGSGAVIIGGLYWNRGTTSAAWAAMIVGAIVSVSGIIVKQISPEWLTDQTSLMRLKETLLYIRNINGQEYWGISMGLSSLSYVSVSLFNKTETFNMDKLLNRGEHAIRGERKLISKNSRLRWRIFMMGNEFTKSDKLIYILNYAWTGFWTLVFATGTIYNLLVDVNDERWMSFWGVFIYIHLAMSLITMFWFTVGGFKDLKIMIAKLRIDIRDHSDDGWVSEG